MLSSLGASNCSVGDMLLELCVTELEDVATDTERIKSVPQPVTQESSHPYTGKSAKLGSDFTLKLQFFAHILVTTFNSCS